MGDEVPVDVTTQVDVVEVIQAAATSPLGIVALLSILIAGLAIRFFKDSPVAIRAAMFLVAVAAFMFFAWLVVSGMQITNETLRGTPPVVEPLPNENPSQPGDVVISEAGAGDGVQEARFERNLESCSPPVSGTWTVEAPSSAQIDTQSVSLDASGTSQNSSVEILSAQPGEIVVGYTIVNHGACGPTLFGRPAFSDIPGHVVATVSYSLLSN